MDASKMQVKRWGMVKKLGEMVGRATLIGPRGPIWLTGWRGGRGARVRAVAGPCVALLCVLPFPCWACASWPWERGSADRSDALSHLSRQTLSELSGLGHSRGSVTHVIPRDGSESAFPDRSRVGGYHARVKFKGVPVGPCQVGRRGVADSR